MNGDSCLREVAQTIRASVRATDACFRWGGDEFAALLPNGDAARTAEPLSVSCGHTPLQDGMETQALLEAADLALLTLKRSLAR